MTESELPVRFGADGLVPAVITDATDGKVLMIGFMNHDALTATRETGYVHFWSRSRGELWKKGGTSGHVQRVESIAINCDQNALLIEARQTGAVCHDGYPTCFYRRLEPDNTLTVTHDRRFDPRDVYGNGAGLAGTTRRWWGAYETLCDTDLEGKSATSRMLRAKDDRITPRIADELLELAGALDGSHRHVDISSDVALEAGQVCYWVALRCVRDHLTWDEVRPDRALDPAVAPAGLSLSAVGALLRHAAGEWPTVEGDLTASFAHETLSRVREVCALVGVSPATLVEADLRELRTRHYLDDYFAASDAATG
jgi:phosphoribosyl-AMP cyclohydrolase